MMKISLKENDIRSLRIISQIAGAFTLVVAITMIFSFIQLKTINPLDNPALLSIKEQYDRDPANPLYAQQVRAMDLMARKAYFSSRWQVETGSYLLIAGALVFILCQRLISGNEKIIPVFPAQRPDEQIRKSKSRNWLMISASVILLTALASSFILRGDLPDTSSGKSQVKRNKTSAVKIPKPDKTNFPSFRGLDSRGIAGGSGYASEWNGEEGKNILWKAEAPKPGKNSPVIWENKLFLTGSEDLSCEVYCFDKKSGSLIWTVPVSGIAGEPTELPQMDQESGLATSTVAVNEDVVCAIFANGNVVCLDHDGKSLWSRNIGIPENIYGYSSSILIYEDLLIVQFDSDKKISLMGIDTKTGETRWETIRNGRPVWSSPVIAYFEGKAQVIVNGNPFVSAYDALTGAELWAVECMTGDVAPSAAANSSLVYAVTDYAKLVALKPGQGASVKWEDNAYTPDVSSPVATDSMLIVATGYGDIACYNAAKGDTLWTHLFNEQFYASPVVADGKIYLLDRSGMMHVVKEDRKFEIIAESPLGERADCTPAFSDRKIYIRGKKNIYCIGEN